MQLGDDNKLVHRPIGRNSRQRFILADFDDENNEAGEDADIGARHQPAADAIDACSVGGVGVALCVAFFVTAIT